jgi:hypothetical protein
MTTIIITLLVVFVLGVALISVGKQLLTSLVTAIIHIREERK